MKTPTYYQGKNYLELGDKLYNLAFELGLPEEWAAKKQKEIADEIAKTKKIDLTKA